MQWHHENVAVACLGANEVHTPPGDPQDKLHLLKTILNTKRKYQEPLWNSPENLDSEEKSQIWFSAREFQYKTNAKRINTFGLMV